MINRDSISAVSLFTFASVLGMQNQISVKLDWLQETRQIHHFILPIFSICHVVRILMASIEIVISQILPSFSPSIVGLRIV